jgi:hypothetical protein
MATRSTRGQRKDVMLTIPIEPRHDPLTKVAAARDQRPVAGYIRNLILQDLKNKGLVDEDFNPVPQPEEVVVGSTPDTV